MKYAIRATCTVLALAAPAAAQDVFITQDMPFVEIDNGYEVHVIERDQNKDAVIDAEFAKTSRPCPPFCVQPMQVAEGVETVGELELIRFLEDEVQAGTGALIDARLESWFLRGTIPGSTNLNFQIFDNPDTNPFLGPVLQLFGAAPTDEGWDFADAKRLALFCNGPWCGQSPRAIRNLLSVGYPPEKLLYYRGGMQSWRALGLSTVVPAPS